MYFVYKMVNIMASWMIIFSHLMSDNKFFLVFTMSISLSILWILLNMFMFNYLNKFLFNFLGYVILLFLTSSNVWKLLLLYEFSIFPMIFILLGWGVNPSRFSATFYMMAYALGFSLPSIGILISNFKMWSFLNVELCVPSLSFINMMILLLLFLVKVPTYFLHYWLPKAHVEASTSGSMILSGGMLKMGSIGTMKLMMWTKFYSNSNYFIVAAGISCLMCLVQTDLKKLIAFMSVVHMNISLSSLGCCNNMGQFMFLMINVIHTIMSSFMFYMTGVISSLSKTRIMMLIFMSNFKFLNILFILMIISNLGYPPFFTMIGEWWTFSNLVSFNYLLMGWLIFVILTLLTMNLSILNFFKVKEAIYVKNSSFLGIIYFLSIIMVFMMIIF